MSSSPSSSAVAARQALAARLVEIRKDAGINGRELSDRCGWNPAKTSRIQDAKTSPSDADIRAWCAACGAEEQAADLIAASRAVESMYVEWKRLQRTGLRVLQEEPVPLFERTRQFRIYSADVIPGLFQTEAYASALLTAITNFRRIPNDVADAVAARRARSHVIHEGDHRFSVVVEEWVLRSRIADADAMRGQLVYLLGVMALPRVSLGIIPFTAKRHMWPVETFGIYDSELAGVELVSAQVTVTAPNELALYSQAFTELQRLAVYGAKARALVTAAIDALG